MKEGKDKAVFIINGIKGTSSHSIMAQRVHGGEVPPCVCFIVQFIRPTTWSVRANPVTAQQKAKLRGVRGCRTGRLTG